MKWSLETAYFAFYIGQKNFPKIAKIENCGTIIVLLNLESSLKRLRKKKLKKKSKFENFGTVFDNITSENNKQSINP